MSSGTKCSPSTDRLHPRRTETSSSQLRRRDMASTSAKCCLPSARLTRHCVSRPFKQSEDKPRSPRHVPFYYCTWSDPARLKSDSALSVGREGETESTMPPCDCTSPDNTLPSLSEPIFSGLVKVELGLTPGRRQIQYLDQIARCSSVPSN